MVAIVTEGKSEDAEDNISKAAALIMVERCYGVTVPDQVSLCVAQERTRRQTRFIDHDGQEGDGVSDCFLLPAFREVTGYFRELETSRVYQRAKDDR